MHVNVVLMIMESCHSNCRNGDESSPTELGETVYWFWDLRAIKVLSRMLVFWSDGASGKATRIFIIKPIPLLNLFQLLTSNESPGYATCADSVSI